MMLKKYGAFWAVALSLTGTAVEAKVIDFTVKLASDPGMPSWVQMYSQLGQHYSSYQIIDRLHTNMNSTIQEYNRSLAVIDAKTGAHRVCQDAYLGSPHTVIIHYNKNNQALRCDVELN